MKRHWYLLNGVELRKKYYRAKSFWGIYKDSTPDPAPARAPDPVQVPAVSFHLPEVTLPKVKKRKNLLEEFLEIIRNIIR